MGAGGSPWTEAHPLQQRERRGLRGKLMAPAVYHVLTAVRRLVGEPLVLEPHVAVFGGGADLVRKFLGLCP